MKGLFLVILLCLCTVASFAQNAPDLDNILRITKEKYTPADTLDRIAVTLHYFEQTPPTTVQREKLIEIYKQLANAFGVAYHFKQGYFAYEKSISYKMNKLAAEKAAAIEHQNKQYEEQNNSDEQQVANLQATQQQLSHDVDSLVSRRANFKRIFSAIVAILSLLFATSLFRSGIKLKDLKNETTANRDKLMQNHRIALLGSLAVGLKETIISNNEKVKAVAGELLSKLPSESKTKEVKAKLKELAT